MTPGPFAPLTLGPYRIERPILLAPMAGVSERPYRAIALAFGAGLAPTELISARGLADRSARSLAYLSHDPRIERPFVVQLFGGEPESLAEAAERAVERGAHVIDLNMGCPVPKVTKGGGGSALMLEPDRAAAIVAAIRARVGVPVTVKIRAGWDESRVNAVEFAKRLEGAGAAWITLHPRTRAEGYGGRADHGLTRRLVQALSIPVIANGDLFSPADVLRVRAETGCAGVMIGRAALGYPFIFRELNQILERGVSPELPQPAERGALIQTHFSAHLEFVGDPLRAVRQFRQHALWYSRGLIGAAGFREAFLAEEDLEAARGRLLEYFARADYEAPDAARPSADFDVRRALG